jgi:hypothetical protein
MVIRPAAVVRRLLRSDSLGAAAAAASAALVTRAALPQAAGADGPLLLVGAGLFAAVEVAAALVRRRAGPGPLARSSAAARARLAVALTALLSASGLSAAGLGARSACLAALLLVLLVLPAAPLAGARLLEAELARRMPQLVAGRLVSRVGLPAALAVPAALLLLPRVRADLPAVVALVVLSLFLLGGVRRACDDAFVRELDLQARRDGVGLAPEPRDARLVGPSEPESPALRPLTPEQFRSFRDECERRSRRR